jgi:hypothetical protein
MPTVYLTKKRCSRCNEMLPVAQFAQNRARRDGISSYCIPCCNEATRVYTLRRRLEVLALFGSRCNRCGFDDHRALQIDHINGGGAQERKGISPSVFHRMVEANPERYQVLCANCNVIKRAEQKEIGNRTSTRLAQRVKEAPVVVPFTWSRKMGITETVNF